MNGSASPETPGVGLTRQAIIDAININVSVSMGDYYLEHVEDAANAILAILPADKSQTDMGERVAELTRDIDSLLLSYDAGHAKVIYGPLSHDYLTALTYERDALLLRARALLNPKLEG